MKNDHNYPEYAKNDLRKVIIEKAHRLISMQYPFGAPSRTNEGKQNLREDSNIENHLLETTRSINDYYKKVFGWIPANPSKPELKDAIKEIYVFTSFSGDDVAGPRNYVNSLDGHRAFRNQIMKNPDTDIIFLIGPKGSGKTCYLNYFVNTENENLYEQKKIWYRAELSKLFRHNKEAQKARKPVYTLDDYFNIHVAYVSFKYRKNNPIFERVWNDDNGTITDKLLRKWNEWPELQRCFRYPKNLVVTFKKFIERVMTKEVEHGKNLMQVHVEEILRKPLFVKMSRCLMDVILWELREHDFQPILIIDGIDNIDYYEDSVAYSDMIDQVINYCFSFDKQNAYGAKFVISCRTETHEHIRSRAKTFFHNNNIRDFRVKVNNPFEILTHKVLVARNPACDFFKTKRDQSVCSVKSYFELTEPERDIHLFIEESDNLLGDFNSKFLDHLVSAIQKIIPDTYHINSMFQNKGKDLFNYFYNGNFRQFIHNFINIYKYRQLYWERSRHIYQRERSFVYTEGQLLNGCLYLETAITEHDFGKCIPNFFWFDVSIKDKTWHGLCLLRITQYIKAYQSREQITDIMVFDNIQRIFNYDLDQIKKSFYYGLSQGLIDCYLSPQNNVTYKLSDKGAFLMDYIFFDINLFYYFALDSPMSIQSIERRNHIRIHENSDTAYWGNYIESCVLTSLTFIRHILTQNSLERNIMTNADKQSYKLSEYFPDLLIDGIMAQIARMKKFDDPTRLSNLLNDIRGIT